MQNEIRFFTKYSVNVFTHACTEKIFHQINYLLISLVNVTFPKFCHKRVKVNFHYLIYLQSWRVTHDVHVAIVFAEDLLALPIQSPASHHSIWQMHGMPIKRVTFFQIFLFFRTRNFFFDKFHRGVELFRSWGLDFIFCKNSKISNFGKLISKFCEFWLKFLLPGAKDREETSPKIKIAKIIPCHIIRLFPTKNFLCWNAAEFEI